MDMLGPELDGWRAARYQQRGLAPSAVNGPFTVERHVAEFVLGERSPMPVSQGQQTAALLPSA
jgi:hypothetical protein